MEYFLDFILFLLKTITLLGGFLVVISMIILLGQKAKSSQKGRLEITKLNENLLEMKEKLQHIVLSKEELKKQEKQNKKDKKNAKKNKDEDEDKPRVFVIDFHGDIKASAVNSLREEISAVLTIARKFDEIIVRLESAGGMVHSYGLASSQLSRIRNKGVKLTIAIDKVAASGGYMMACTGNKILAAPFAIIGSIGVIAQLPNFSKLLKKHEVDLELHTAGEFKRTLTLFGENNDKGREKFKQDIEETHGLFKQFIKECRDEVNIDQVATGEIWYGKRAIDLKLVDEIITSDEYICNKAEKYDVIQVTYVVKKGITDKLGLAAYSTVDSILTKCWETLNSKRFFS